ncbi:flagellar basal body rod protein [Paenibacillus swuensis]|uniref:Flagellar basal body rod protein n=1 Tax=Paenibacillus swuensis TaxID=1178515 RepID=A0A172TIF7_9BACL|nr:flagellar hook-basal body protein [Paenibacillus swuensis]ANE46684.1 flagellar basal body rod protein [Paenibacillus swuensis]
MLRGLYTAAAGMIAQQRRHDTVTNNIANVNTPGFKQDQAVNRSFPEMLIALTGGDANPASPKIGRLNSGVLAEEPVTLHLQGDLQETRNAGDFALVSNIQVDGMNFDAGGKFVSPDGQVSYQPQAYFTVQNADGELRYTRNGKFVVGNGGELLTTDGSRVLGANGQPIQLDRPLTDYRVMENGQFADARTGDAFAQQLLISRVENPYDLVREGDGNFRLTGDAQAAALAQGDQVQLRQGFVERSNVDAATAMVDLMTAQRAYEANQKMIQYYDRSMEKAVTEIGRV